MKAAVVDDSREDASQLLEYLERFQAEQGITIQTTVYYASFDFLEEYNGQYDVVFLTSKCRGAMDLRWQERYDQGTKRLELSLLPVWRSTPLKDTKSMP
jgi:ribosomal protein S12 methylthiotransferase accessory factor YcaO